MTQLFAATLVEYPAIETVVSEYRMVWDYTLPHRFDADLAVAEHEDEPSYADLEAAMDLGDRQIEMINTLEKLIPIDHREQTNLQRKNFLLAYIFLSNEFFLIKGAYEKKAAHISNLKERSLHNPVFKRELDRLRSLHRMASTYHSQIASRLLRLNSVLNTATEDKLFALDAFFDFASRAHELGISDHRTRGSKWSADSVGQDILQYLYLGILNERIVFDRTKFQKFVPALHTSSAILAAIKSALNQDQHSSVELARLRILQLKHLWTDYWKAFADSPARMLESLVDFEAMRQQSCGWQME